MNNQNKEGRTSLHFACFQSMESHDILFEILIILLRKGADLNVKDAYGRTPLHYCFAPLQKNHPGFKADPIELVNILLKEKNIDVNIIGKVDLVTPRRQREDPPPLRRGERLLDFRAQLDSKGLQKGLVGQGEQHALGGCDQGEKLE